ncbi:MAG: hypothetical protein Q8P25_03590, partial [Candidatus Curtissbacteria bacterium]|nr:hypothetical protein [Candidatus Curtissbacteria bacterium]
MTANFGLLILPVIFLIAPMILTVASKQSAGIKQILRYVLQASYSSIILLGVFNWETQTADGRNAYMLALDFQNNYLLGFFVLTLALIAILQFRKYEFDVITAIGNGLATALFFAATIT